MVKLGYACGLSASILLLHYLFVVLVFGVPYICGATFVFSLHPRVYCFLHYLEVNNICHLKKTMCLTLRINLLSFLSIKPATNCVWNQLHMDYSPKPIYYMKNDRIYLTI